jgi:hypothetical protein
MEEKLFSCKPQCAKTGDFRGFFARMPKILVGKKGPKTQPFLAAAKVGKK